MRRSGLFVFGIVATLIAQLISFGCAPTGNSNLTAVNTNANAANSMSNSNLNAVSTTGSSVDAREPEEYQAAVKLSFQTMGSQPASLPTLGANVARSGDDRMMEFNLPTNEKVIFLDKGGMNYLILPSRKQYAELNKESLGFDVRRMLMPEQIVQQAKAVPGMKLVGEETQNGRQVVKYAYQAVANTNTSAGTVQTESYMLVDKETGLPLHTETVSQSQNGNVNGVNGVRIVTEMTDIKTSPDRTMFDLPTDYKKIDPETVRAQVNAVFNAVSLLIGQVMQQQQQAANANAAPSPTSSVSR
jgi:hypothetical protein